MVPGAVWTLIGCNSQNRMLEPKVAQTEGNGGGQGVHQDSEEERPDSPQGTVKTGARG